MTETSRRALLRASAAGAAGTALLSVGGTGTAPAAAAAAQSKTAARLYRRARFTPLRRRTFTLSGSGRTWTVKLVKVRNLPRAARGDQRRFTLTFSTPVAGPDQGTYLLRRRGFTPTKLFVVPSDETCRMYEAVINRR